MNRKINVLIIVSVTLLVLFSIKDNYNIEENNNIINIKKIAPKEIILNKELFYLAVGDEIDINNYLDIKLDNLTWTSDDPEIVTINNGNITGITSGKANIMISNKDSSKEVEVIVSDLITKPTINKDKQYLPCNRYTLEEATLLDNILENRINTAGYQTRAGVIAAARFLLLEFPYTIKYFNENGRLNNHSGQSYVDGEGRYYHKGLYLHESKFEDLKATRYGPAIWGCSLWDSFLSKYASNGFTCSGFVTWVLLNGGFDIGDSGAGNTFRDDDVGDLGENIPITKELMASGKVKAGDIIGRDGHVAVIIGLDETNIYIAEALPSSVRLVILTKYDGLIKSTNFTYIILMDEIYEKTGNYTEMWN